MSGFPDWLIHIRQLSSGSLASLTGCRGYAELDTIRETFHRFGLGVAASEPNAYRDWREAWAHFIGCVTGKRALYDAGAYLVSPTPVCSARWDRDAWIAHIDAGGGRWIPQAAKGAPYPARDGYQPSEGVSGCAHRDALPDKRCRACRAWIATEYGRCQPVTHQAREGTREDPRAPGDRDDICDVCQWGERG